LQLPIGIPTIDFLPLPRQTLQEIVLWPWQLGHKTLVGIGLPPKQFAPMCRPHLNYATGRYIDSAIVPEPTGKFERVLAITVSDCQDQIAVFRNCLNGTDEMPHAPSSLRHVV
jgi:hypothetical protein